MKIRKSIFPVALFAFLVTSLSSCDFIVGVFKGGVYVGIIIVIVVIAVVIWLLSKINKR